MIGQKTWIVQNDIGPVGVYITKRLASMSSNHNSRVVVAPRKEADKPIEMHGENRPRAIILGGSLSSVVERQPWMEWEYRLIRQAIHEKVPLLGLCFGHQAIAVAMGGSVERKGMARGPKNIVPERQSALFQGIQDWRFVGTHEDQVATIPPHFERIASSDYCSVQGMQHETLPVFGVQFHPCYDEKAAQVQELGLTTRDAYYNADGQRLIDNFLELAAPEIVTRTT